MRTYKYLLVFFSFMALAVKCTGRNKTRSDTTSEGYGSICIPGYIDRECKFGDLKGNYIFFGNMVYELWPLPATDTLF